MSRGALADSPVVAMKPPRIAVGVEPGWGCLGEMSETNRKGGSPRE